MKKCDVIIPVYDESREVKLCVYSIIENTEIQQLNKVILIDNSTEIDIQELLFNLKEKYKNKIEIISGLRNGNRIDDINKAWDYIKTEYLLILDCGCIISKNIVEKLINHIENCNNIGVICPIVSDKSDLGIPIFEGFNYAQMNVLLERKFKGIDFDTKAPSTQCLMISRKCLIATGVFNDYAKIGICLKKLLIKVLQKNFKIRVAIDTYVYVSDKLDFKEKRDNINIYNGPVNSDQY